MKGTDLWSRITCRWFFPLNLKNGQGNFGTLQTQKKWVLSSLILGLYVRKLRVGSSFDYTVLLFVSQNILTRRLLDSFPSIYWEEEVYLFTGGPPVAWNTARYHHLINGEMRFETSRFHTKWLITGGRKSNAINHFSWNWKLGKVFLKIIQRKSSSSEFAFHDERHRAPKSCGKMSQL